jgi:hypothetical protein
MGNADSGRKGLMPFIVISISYLLFTMTDGGVRMLVLLHAYNKGFSAMVRSRSSAVVTRSRRAAVAFARQAWCGIAARERAAHARVEHTVRAGSGHHVFALRARGRRHQHCRRHARRSLGHSVRGATAPKTQASPLARSFAR